MFALKNGVMLGLWSKYTAEPQVVALLAHWKYAFHLKV